MKTLAKPYEKAIKLLKTIFALACCLMVLPLGAFRGHAAKSSENPETSEENVSITISAVGDCTLGVDRCQASLPNFNKEFQKRKSYTYFLRNVKDIFENDDLTIVNLEGTFTTRNTRANKTFAFKGRPSYVNILTKSSVEAVNLANNHSEDYGRGSYSDTVKTLDKAGITHFNGSSVAIMKVKGIRIGLVGIKTMSSVNKEKELKSAIQKCKKKKADLIIVSFHWGIERDYQPNSLQKKHAHLAIESGADLVLGHHPHVLQGIEKYKGKYIVYSLGNFCFGGNTNPPDKDTMIFQQTFTFRNGSLDQGKPAVVYPCSLSSVSNRNNYQPTPLSGKEKDRVLKKINRLSKPFGISFTKKGKARA